MFYLLHYPYKASDFKFYRPVVFLYRGKEPRKNEDWLDDITRWQIFFRNGFTGSSVKDNGSKVKFFRGVKVYSDDLLKIVVY